MSYLLDMSYVLDMSYNFILDMSHLFSFGYDIYIYIRYDISITALNNTYCHKDECIRPIRWLVTSDQFI